MDPFTAAVGPIFTAVAGAALAWILIRGKEAADKAPKPGADPAERRDRFYRRSFESSPVGLAILTPQGQWVKVNDRLRALLGYSRDEMNLLTIRELTHSDDRKLEASYIRKLMRREISSYALEKRLLCKDQKYRRFDVSMVRFEEEGRVQELWQCVVTPVMAPRLDEAAEKSVKLGEVLGPVSDLACISCDDQGIITEWNAGAARIFGYERDEMVGRSRTSLYRDEDVWEQKPRQDLKDAIATGRLEGDCTRVDRDAVELRVRVTIVPDIRDDRVLGFIELAREIDQARGVDQYRQSYERLKEISEERIRSLHKEVSELRQEVDDASGREKSVRETLGTATREARKQLAELRILTDAFRKELDRRRALESELKELMDEREVLDHRMLELERREPVVESDDVELASPSDAHWTPFDHLPVADLLLATAREGRTGTLLVASNSIEKRIFFDRGTIYSCTSNDPSMFLGQILLRQGVISPRDHERALEVHDETGIALGRILVLSGTLDLERLEAAMLHKAEMEILAALDWVEGQSMFVEGEPRSHQLVPVRLDVESIISQREPDAPGSIDMDDTVPATFVPGDPVDLDATIPATPLEEPELAPAEPDEAPAKPAVLFVASRSKRSTRFHRPDCLSAKKIARSKRLEFHSRQAALAHGLEPCKKCLG